jgi:hypothetical protein
MPPYTTLTDQRILDFAAEVHSITQERMSHLMPYVIPKNFSGKYMRYVRTGQMGRPTKKTQRFQDANLTDYSWDTRWKDKERFFHVLGIDSQDEDEIGRSLEPEMVEAAVASIMREVDKQIYAAVEATVRVGETPVAGSDLTATSDGVTVADATGGFGLATIGTLRKEYDDNGVTGDIGIVPNSGGVPADLLLLIGGAEKEDLLSETQLTSVDYVDGKPLIDGNINRVHGVNLLLYPSNVQDPLMPAASNERRLISIARGGLAMGFEKPAVVLQERPDKLETRQVVLSFHIAVLRTEGKRCKVIRVAA